MGEEKQGSDPILRAEKFFSGWLGASLLSYITLILLLLIACFVYVLGATTKDGGYENLASILSSQAMLDSIILTFVSCTVSSIFAVFVAVPVGYLLSRYKIKAKALIEAVLDIPIILPPLVMGLSLLILFNQFPFADQPNGTVESWFRAVGIEVTNTKLAVVIAQFTISTAFAIRTMKIVFDQIPQRSEEIAMTMGASRGRAFFDVILPQSYKGVLAAGTLSWARSLGEFGPILVFAGATRGKTEVLATTIYLELNTGNLEGAVAVSLMMVLLAIVSIVIVRCICERRLSK